MVFIESKYLINLFLGRKGSIPRGAILVEKFCRLLSCLIKCVCIRI